MNNYEIQLLCEQACEGRQTAMKRPGGGISPRELARQITQEMPPDIRSRFLHRLRKEVAQKSAAVVRNRSKPTAEQVRKRLDELRRNHAQLIVDCIKARVAADHQALRDALRSCQVPERDPHFDAIINSTARLRKEVRKHEYLMTNKHGPDRSTWPACREV